MTQTFAHHPLSRIGALDGLRGIAAIAVLAFHCRLPGLDGGFIGVEVFFVLSGYVITRLLRAELAENRALDIGGFFVRRLQRLYPALLLMAAGFAIAAPFAFPDANLVRELAPTLLYMTDYAFAYFGFPDVLRHGWSLAVEMKFYLLWPFVVLWLGRQRPVLALLVLSALVILSTAWRFHQLPLLDIDRLYHAADTRLSGLFVGAWLAYLPKIPERIATGLAWAGLLLLVPLTSILGFHGAQTPGSGLVIVDMASAMLVFGLAQGKGTLVRSLSAPALVRLGAWSYALYLWHYPLARYFRPDMDGLTCFAIVLPISLVLAALTHELVEKPLFVHWRRRRQRSNVAIL